MSDYNEICRRILRMTTRSISTTGRRWPSAANGKKQKTSFSKSGIVYGKAQQPSIIQKQIREDTERICVHLLAHQMLHHEREALASLGKLSQD